MMRIANCPVEAAIVGSEPCDGLQNGLAGLAAAVFRYLQPRPPQTYRPTPPNSEEKSMPDWS